MMRELNDRQTFFLRRITLRFVLAMLTGSFAGVCVIPAIANSAPGKFDLDLAERSIVQNFRKGRFEESAEHAARLVEHHEKHGDTTKLIRALGQLSKAEVALGDYQSAKTNLEKALVLAQSTDNRAITASVLGELGSIAITSGGSAHAEQYLKKAIELLQDVNAPGVKAVIDRKASCRERV